MNLSEKFELGNGDVVDLVESGNSVYIKDSESGCTITSNSHFGYIQSCYSHLDDHHDAFSGRPCVIHLGIGFGYDLLYASNFLKKRSGDYRVVGVDLTDYSGLRVTEDQFDCPVEFHNKDVMLYLSGVKPEDFRDGILPEREVIVLVDLFLKGNTPIDLVYDDSLWCAIRDNIDPGYVVVNRCGGFETFPVASRVLGPCGYVRSWCLEFYHRKKND